MRVLENTNFEFIRHRRLAYVVSGVLIGLALIMAVFWQVTRGSWLNYGVDFTGGTLVQIQFQEPVEVEDVRSAIEAVIPRTEVTRFGGENEFLIRAPQFGVEAESGARQIESALGGRFGADKFEVTRVEAVGPKVGSELQRKAATAVILSFLATLVYLAFRFEWRFGLAAVIATVYDTLLTLGIISAFRLEVSLTTVAAVLTIIGYSLNDKIVVFDRIRDNLKRTGRRESYIAILDRSINDTLSRTVMTGGSTLAVLLALLVLGGPIIRDFALILFLGIVIGTFSSIFIASPILLEVEERWGGEGKARAGAKPARAAGARV
jgi:preprotein translocase subunit SecF